MILQNRESYDIDVQSLVEVLARKGFQPQEIRAHLESYELPVPDMSKVAAFKRTAATVTEDIESVVRDAVIRLGHAPSEDEEAWILAEAARMSGDALLESILLEAGTAPGPDSPPKNINPKAIKVWKKMFKEHGKEISDAKKAKQWGVAVAIFKNLAKSEGYAPFMDKAAWTLDSLVPNEITTALSTLTALAQNLEDLGLEDLASEVDQIAASFEERLLPEEHQAAIQQERARLAAKKQDFQAMAIGDFCQILAQILDESVTSDFVQLFKKTSDALRSRKGPTIVVVQSIYDNFLLVFEDNKKFYLKAPPEAFEHEMFSSFIGYVIDALRASVTKVGEMDAAQPDKNSVPVNVKKLKHYLLGSHVEQIANKVASRSLAWRKQFGL